MLKFISCDCRRTLYIAYICIVAATDYSENLNALLKRQDARLNIIIGDNKKKSLIYLYGVSDTVWC